MSDADGEADRSGEIRALIIGETGQVGGALVERLGPELATGTRAPSEDPRAPRIDLAQLPEDPAPIASWLAPGRFDAVFVCGAMTWVDGCEADAARAHLINCLGPAVVARTARAAGARTVFVSTEYVFDGRGGPYSETDAPNPLSVYGQSKLDGERAVLAEDPDALVVRTTVVYGPEDRGKNFAYRLASEIAAGRRLRVPVDQVTSPTYNRDLAAAMVALVARGVTGVVHVAGDEVMSRFDHARRVALAAGLPAAIDPIQTAALGQPAARPLDAGLDVRRLRALVPGITLHTVEQAVSHWTAHPRGRPWPDERIEGRAARSARLGDQNA